MAALGGDGDSNGVGDGHPDEDPASAWVSELRGGGRPAYGVNFSGNGASGE